MTSKIVVNNIDADAGVSTVAFGSKVSATEFIGPITGNVTGDVTGNVTGDVTGNLTGDVTGNVTGGTLTGITSISTTNLTVNGNAYPSAGSLSNRNLIINGAMQVAQRVAYPNTQPGVSYSNYYTVDRWRFNIQDTHFGTWTFSQSDTVPAGEGFAYSWKWDCTTADTSLDSGHFGIAEYRIEAQDLQHLEYGTSSAKPVTISFWVKTNKTGTYVFSIFATDGPRYVSKTYTVDVANAWEYKTITIDGDTAGTIDNDTDDGFRLWWWLGSGSTFTSGTMQPGVWRPWSELNGSAPGLSVNMADSTLNEWFITGVQLEVGTVATPFEHRSYGDELARCQRYYYRNSPALANATFCAGFNNATNQAQFLIELPVPMRVAPTSIDVTGTSSDYQIAHLSTVTTCTGGPAITSGRTTTTCRIEADVSSGLTAGQSNQLRSKTTDAYIGVNAEL